LLPSIQDNSAIKISSLLLLRDLECPAIMTATNVIFSLQLIVELILTGTKQVAPSTILNNSFKLIDVLALEGATFAPHISEDAFDFHTTLMDQDEGMTKPQNAHLRSASQQSFSSVRVPFSTICPFGGSSCWVQSLAVKVQASSTPTVSRHAFALFAFEPITSTKQISFPNTALNATAEMQPSADISLDP
jgi:hypothetical protein